MDFYWINKTFSLYNKRQIKIMSIYQLVDNQSIMLFVKIFQKLGYFCNIS